VHGPAAEEPVAAADWLLGARHEPARQVELAALDDRLELAAAGAAAERGG
jgi:hypothetical protein